MTAHTLQPGTTLRNGRYTIRQVLGKGSFGITYRATTKATVRGPFGNTETEIDVAIKEFYMTDFNRRGKDGCSVTGVDSAVFANYQHRFRREAENLASLQHDHIVRVAEVFDENNTTYFVMQYIDGQDLDGHIAKRGRLPEEEAIVILRQVAEALAYMHDHRMLHLDIKPKNIMLDTAGNAYLVDFGLSKHFNAKGEPESSSTIGLGTKGYAPMEQASYVPDGKTFPATLDIYALGATLYKMLTGKCAPDSTEVFNEGLPMAPLKEAGISQATQQLILKAMAPQRKQRYQTVGEFLTDLSSPDDETTIIEHPLLPPNKKKKSRKTLIIFLLLLILTLCAAVLFLLKGSNNKVEDKDTLQSTKPEPPEIDSIPIDTIEIEDDSIDTVPVIEPDLKAPPTEGKNEKQTQESNTKKGIKQQTGGK